LDAIQKVARDPNLVPVPSALQSGEVQKRLVVEVTDKLNSGQLSMYPEISQKDLALVVREATAIYVTYTIAIPRVIVLPKGVVRAGFHEFALALSSFRLQPVSQEILIQHLASDTRETVGTTRSALRTMSCVASSTSMTSATTSSRTFSIPWQASS
jgi:type III restriction enzyme